MQPQIAILGAGPSGLMLGRLLHVHKIDFIIFEKDNSPSEASQGGSLDIHGGTGQLALQEAGLLDLFNSLARNDAVSTVLADKHGVVAMRMNQSEANRPEIDRRDLRALLLGSIPQHKVRWDSKVESVARDADGTVSIHFQDGSLQTGFKLVVGADGIWSKARAMVTSVLPRYSGYFYATSAITPSNPQHLAVETLAGVGTYMACSDGKMATAQRTGDGTYTIGIGMDLPDPSTIPSDPIVFRQWLLDDCFPDWSEANRDLVRCSEGNWRPWPLYAMPVDSMPWKPTAGVTLLGDAAHVSTPFGGEGVNCAMHDSLHLAQQIVKHGLDHLDQAIEEYEKLMFPRAAELITESETNGKLLCSSDAPWSFVKAHSQ